PWEIEYGQIAIPAKNYEITKKIFKNYLNIYFNLETFKGNFRNRNFLDKGNRLRFACMPFFSKLNVGDIVYIQPLNQNTIRISKEKPVRKMWILKIANILFFFIKKQLMGLLKYLQR
ncbi:unnamed protein product, partial [marine sediment metagenome]